MKLHTTELQKREWERRKRAMYALRREHGNWCGKWSAAKYIAGSHDAQFRSRQMTAEVRALREERAK